MKRTHDPSALKRAEELFNDGNQEKWETGQLGNEPSQVVVSKDGDAFNKEKAKSFRLTSIRLDCEMIDELTKRARSLGMGYQTYIRMILSQHLKDKPPSRQ